MNIFDDLLWVDCVFDFFLDEVFYRGSQWSKWMNEYLRGVLDPWTSVGIHCTSIEIHWTSSTGHLFTWQPCINELPAEWMVTKILSTCTWVCLFHGKLWVYKHGYALYGNPLLTGCTINPIIIYEICIIVLSGDAWV